MKQVLPGEQIKNLPGMDVINIYANMYQILLEKPVKKIHNQDIVFVLFIENKNNIVYNIYSI